MRDQIYNLGLLHEFAVWKALIDFEKTSTILLLNLHRIDHCFKIGLKGLEYGL